MLNLGTTKMLSKWIAFGLVLGIISYASATAQRSPYNKNEGTKDLPTKTDTVTDKSNIKDNQESASVKGSPDGDGKSNDPVKKDEPVKNDQNIQAGSRSSEETGGENGPSNGPSNGQTESIQCEMIPSPHIRAFDVDEQSGRKTFSEPFNAMMSRSKNDKEILMKLKALMTMLEEFLKSLHPLSTKWAIRKLFRSLNLGDQRLLFRIKSLFRVGSDEDFTAKEFNDFISIIRTLDKEPMNGAVNRMNDQMLKLLCTDHLIKFPCLSMFAALEAMKSKDASCLQFDNVPNKIQFDSLKIKWNKSPKDWQADNWNEIIHTYMDVFVEFHILHHQIPDNIVLQMWQPISIRCGDFPKPSKKVLFKKIKGAYGKLTKNMKGEYKTPVFRFIKKCGGDASEFATKEEEINEFKPGDSKIMSSRKRAEMARNVPKALGKNPSELTTEEIIQYIELLMSNRHFLKQLNSENLKLAICKIGEMKDLKLKSVIKFKQVMMAKIPEYRTINSYDISKVRCLHHLLAGYNRHQIRRIPDNVIAASIKDGILKDVRFRCFPGELKAGEMMNFGIMLRCFRAKHWKDIKPEEFTDEVIEQLATGYEMRNIKPRRNLMIAILDLATHKEGAMDKLAATYLGSFLPEGVGKGYIIARQLQNGMKTIMECTCEEAKICWNELTEILGPLSEWETSFITKLVGSTIWYGMDLVTIGSIPDSILYSFPPEDLMSANCSSFKQIGLMFRRSRIFREEESFDSSALVDQETETNPIKGLQWFYNASMADLRKYNEETREQICVELGAVDISRVSIQDIREKIQICPWCTPSVLTNEIFEKCGTLMCGLSRSQIMNIDADAFKTYAKDLCEKCPWNTEHKNVLIRAGMQSEAINSSMPSFTEVDICTLGTCTKSLSKELLESIPLEMLYTSNECITESSEKKKSRICKSVRHVELRKILQMRRRPWRKRRKSTIAVYC
ncbi:uncharacterized protein LOC134710743 [Mytilus trossulus]|uniref:uncharacterized protein LOC134710743 n=1 Tax=Mytilus trossulus TaxID=6551 RepID=UPI0030057EFF